MGKKQVVLGFKINDVSITDLQKLSYNELYELYRSSNNSLIYNVNDFFENLNCDMIDDFNYFWFFAEIKD